MTPRTADELTSRAMNHVCCTLSSVSGGIAILLATEILYEPTQVTVIPRKKR